MKFELKLGHFSSSAINKQLSIYGFYGFPFNQFYKRGNAPKVMFFQYSTTTSNFDS